MTQADPTPLSTPDTKAGLRQRKKARRRQDILQAAARLFEEQGFDATTLAEIAQDVGVSPPTVSNYFGSKENILIALITEGAEHERTEHLKHPRKTGCPFAEVLGDLLCASSVNTMRIAGKRVWRYGEATNIRRPNTEFERKFAETDTELLNLIGVVLGDYDIALRNGEPPDVGFLAQIVFDRWSARYLAYIKDDAMPMESHLAALREDAEKLVKLLFDEDFAATSPLREKDGQT